MTVFRVTWLPATTVRNGPGGPDGAVSRNSAEGPVSSEDTAEGPVLTEDISEGPVSSEDASEGPVSSEDTAEGRVSLKRSFEVENADSSSQSSSPHMRRSPIIQRSAISPSISRRHELGANGAVKSKPHIPEPAPRRSELSIGINAKAADSS
ncbi:septin-9-like isoform X2, partial [Clarias magur]